MGDSPESDLIEELRALAGAPVAERDRFTIRHEGSSIEIAYTSGTSSSLTLSAHYDRSASDDHPALRERTGAGYRDAARIPLVASRPLTIELRREGAADVSAKLEGVSVEWQSGDDAFDDCVYVSTPTSDPAILSAVLGPEVRRGVLTLLELGFHVVHIDQQGYVRAHLSEFAHASASTHARRGTDAIQAFGSILSNLPAIASSGSAVERVPYSFARKVLATVGVVGWLLNVGYVGIVMAAVTAIDPGARRTFSWLEITASVLAALVAGVVGAILFGGAVRVRVRGTSRAHEHVWSSQVAAFGGVSVVVFTLALVFAAVVGGK